MKNVNDGDQKPDTKMLLGGALVVALFTAAYALKEPHREPANYAPVPGEAEEAAKIMADMESDDPGSTGAPASDWSYTERKDELRDKTAYYAKIDSSNSVTFGFPYGGPQSLMMTVRSSPHFGRDVLFQIPSGQFTCGIDDCRGMISFDGKAEPLTLVEPSDHSSDVLFAKYGDAIIRKIKASKKVIVELTFYQEGSRQFTFNTEGLKWDH